MLGAVSDALVSLAETAILGASVHIGPPNKSRSSPTEIAIWLYHVEQDRSDEHLPSRNPDGSIRSPRQMSFALHYLVCVSGGIERAAQDSFERLWDELQKVAIMDLDVNGPDELRVSVQIESLDIPTLAAIWTTLGPLPLQPSIAIIVRGPVD